MKDLLQFCETFNEAPDKKVEVKKDVNLFVLMTIDEYFAVREFLTSVETFTKGGKTAVKYTKSYYDIMDGSNIADCSYWYYLEDPDKIYEKYNNKALKVYSFDSLFNIEQNGDKKIYFSKDEILDLIDKDYKKKYSNKQKVLEK